MAILETLFLLTACIQAAAAGCVPCWRLLCSIGARAKLSMVQGHMLGAPNCNNRESPAQRGSARALSARAPDSQPAFLPSSTLHGGFRVLTGESGFWNREERRWKIKASCVKFLCADPLFSPFFLFFWNEKLNKAPEKFCNWVSSLLTVWCCCFCCTWLMMHECACEWICICASQCHCQMKQSFAEVYRIYILFGHFLNSWFNDSIL